MDKSKKFNENYFKFKSHIANLIKEFEHPDNVIMERYLPAMYSYRDRLTMDTYITVKRNFKRFSKRLPC